MATNNIFSKYLQEKNIYIYYMYIYTHTHTHTLYKVSFLQRDVVI